MIPQQRAPDGLSQLTELMRHEQDTPRKRPPVDPDVRRRRRRRGIIVALIVVVVVLASAGSYVGWALNAPVGAAESTSQAPEVAAPAPAALALPPEGASMISIAGADDYLGPTAAGIWQATGTDGPRPIASISKLITAMVVLSAKPLATADDPGPTITFSKADNALYDKYYVLGATIARMPTGSSMSQHDALEAMLIPSASNYAEAVAGWAFGSQGAFLSATSKWLVANGLTHTTIVEPTGIDTRNTSTPSDLMALGRLAAANPVVAQIVAMPSTDLPTIGVVANTNDLLGADGVTGLKTGNLGDGEFNLLYTASLDVGTPQPLAVVGVLLGGFSHQSVNADVHTLLASIAAGFHSVTVADLGTEVGTYSTPWGSGARMVIGDNASLFTWSDSPITAVMTTTPLTTGEDGEQIGSITYTSGPNSVTVPLELEGTITPPTDWWRLTHPSELGGWPGTK